MTAPELDHQYRKLGFVALLAGVVFLVGFVLAPFAQSLMWATVLSVLTYPLYRRMCKRFSETGSALLTILTTLFCVAIPLALVGLLVFLQFRGIVDDFEPKPVKKIVTESQLGPVVKQNGSKPLVVEVQPDGTLVQKEIVRGEKETATVSRLRQIAQAIDEQLAPQLKKFGIDFSADRYVQDHGAELMQRITVPITKGATTAAVSAVMMVVAFLTMFFMLRDGHKLLAPARELMPIPPAWTDRILARVQKTIHAVFMGVILVAFFQGIAASLGYVIAGVDAWLVWGAATMVLCAVPLLGAPVVYVPLALLLLSQGKIWQGIFLLIWGFGVVSNIDNFLRPKYIGERVGLHYIAIFFSLLGGVLAFGPVGLMVGPILLTVTLELVAYIRECRTSVEVVADAEDALDPA